MILKTILAWGNIARTVDSMNYDPNALIAAVVCSLLLACFLSGLAGVPTNTFTNDSNSKRRLGMSLAQASPECPHCFEMSFMNMLDH